MLNPLTTNGDALRLFFTDDIYLVKEHEAAVNEPVIEPVAIAKISEPVIQQITEVKAIPDFRFLGNNKRNILILVNDQDNDVSDEKGRELLRKIVKSVNLTANDFALLNYAKYKNTSFNQLITHFSSVVVFAFGVSPENLGLVAHPQNTVVTEDKVLLIFSDELRKLEEDQQGKKVLWGSLKKLGL